MSSSIMRVAIAVATCFSVIISSADAFASVKPTTWMRLFGSLNTNIHSSSKRSTSLSSTSPLPATTTSLAASSIMALPLSPPPTYTLFGLNIKKQSSSTKKKQQYEPPLFAIPSIFNSADSRPIILFDGKCNLCNAGVQLILDNDRASSDPRGNLRVAALQSKVGQLLLSRLPPSDMAKVLTLTDGGGGGGSSSSNNNKNEYKSIVVAGDQSTWFNSAACIRIGRDLKGPLRYLALLASLIPSFLRDPLYKLLSKYRKRLFGESAECRLWDENYDMRFVDDGVLTGVYRDPFADPNAAPDDNVDNDEGAQVDLSIGPNVNVGDSVRVISSKPIVHTHVGGYETSGVCSVGLVGKVTRVLEQRAFPKNVAVKFDSVDCGEGEGSSLSFEAHFYPGQLCKE